MKAPQRINRWGGEAVHAGMGGRHSTLFSAASDTMVSMRSLASCRRKNVRYGAEGARHGRHRVCQGQKDATSRHLGLIKLGQRRSLQVIIVCAICKDAQEVELQRMPERAGAKVRIFFRRRSDFVGTVIYRREEKERDRMKLISRVHGLAWGWHHPSIGPHLHVPLCLATLPAQIC